ncbi:aminopeptidase P family protein [Lentimicrobium sp.]|jgi:Xaa-Pro aminopeptidase|uniref:aminopeptidase P family protein n=1 Tax=Lentimicrobium sp. TaxID=2034841 RepID=UPI0025D19BAC|nr:aminopeptidase P family protein [Lentimicrobium sp.]MCO5257894.1 aminopeptidase P family protein [Lentimicrobium sp.]MCO5262168.1 aminopeptidase P family protein [Lentimicrobium sp.]HOP14105.1 aminopeptidase P family protein [Lentimicrobium sp.]HPF63362.1 aminopeptidase P family protein [Lentimicrobium sp.]HPJ63119.1 aminopeptidase P family protein [Lentimicrobium sp.]
MFAPGTYAGRREALRREIKSGIAVFPGNTEAAFNYPANTYHFRQDSTFSYFFGLNQPDLAGIIDFDSGVELLFGNDVDMDDIIWMGPQPSMADRGKLAGIDRTAPLQGFGDYIAEALKKGRKVHFLPPYRGETRIQLWTLLGIPVAEQKAAASVELIKAVVKLRSIKSAEEIAEIEKMVDVAYLMHTTAMKMAHPGIVEQKIAGTIEGIALANAGPVSFPVILSVNGQTLHNHYHGNTLSEGRMMVVDAGCESEESLYSSDITRTVPVGGKFSERQRGIYEIVLNANLNAIAAIKPGIPYREVHLLAAKTIADGLKALGLMKGDTQAAVEAGAHALFFPHGLGHMMGMDVHDMENLGENYVGYDEEITRASQFGTAFLRLGRRLQQGFVLTVEPGIYFIPALIDQWKAEGKFTEFINYEKVETYKDFGGIRIEDDVLVTETGNRVLGRPIPKTVAEIETIMKK